MADVWYILLNLQKSSDNYSTLPTVRNIVTGLNENVNIFLKIQRQKTQKLFPDKQCSLLSILFYKLFHTNHLIPIITIANNY